MGGIVSGIGSFLGGQAQAHASKQAAQQALTGYRYLTSGAGADASNQYINQGTQAAAAMGQLLMPSYAGAPAGAQSAPAFSAAQNTNPFATGGSPSIFSAMAGAVNGGTPGAGAPPGTPGVTPASANSAFNNYLNSTGYQFQMQQGQNAITSSNAARGLLNSGATAQALTQYGQGLASQNFNNYLDQLNTLAGRGQGQLNQVANTGTAAGGNAAGFTQQAGAATGASYMGLANTIGAAMSPAYSSGAPGLNAAINFIPSLF